MESKAAHSIYEEYKTIYEEKTAIHIINQEKYFLNSLEVVHIAPFNDTSYEVNVIAIKDGKVIVFKIQDVIRLFGKPPF